MSLQLSFTFIFSKGFPDLRQYQVVPFPLASSALAHRQLECSNLGHGLQVFNGPNSLCQVVRIRVTNGRLMEDSFKQNGILLEML